jgi:c-di-GMP phosphodiesterase
MTALSELAEATIADRLGIDEVLVARQPIYDAKLGVPGYAVQVCGRSAAEAGIDEDDAAKTESLRNVFTNITLHQLVGERLAFMRLTRAQLIPDAPLPLPPKQLLIEIGGRGIDADYTNAVARRAAEGYIFILDASDLRPGIEGLLPYVAIIKLDVGTTTPSELTSMIKVFRVRQVKLVAGNVQSMRDFERTKTMGFDLFSGPFLTHPQGNQAGTRKAGQLAVMQLLARLGDPKATTGDFEKIIKCDPAISYSLLRYINSSKFGQRTKIESLSYAINLLGVNGVRSLTMMLSLAGFSESPGERLHEAVFRAHFCEMLARRMKFGNPNSYFTAGLVSALDAILDLPVEMILDSISLSDDLRNAILSYAGPMGKVLRCAVSFERADFAGIVSTGFPIAEVRSAYVGAITESSRLWAELLAIKPPARKKGIVAAD